MTVPRWLELQFNIDHGLWLLAEMTADERRRSAFDRMIDNACGVDVQRRADAEELMAEIRAFREEYDALMADGVASR